MDYIVSKDLVDGENIYGKIACSNLQECFNKVKSGDIIYLKSEMYYGKFTLRTPDVTLIGTDDSVISYDAYHGEKIRECDGGDGVKVYGTTGSTTFLVTPMASGFKMFNVTVQNTHKHDADRNQAVAFKMDAEGGYFEECKFYGCQDTLYISKNDNVFYKCIISGTIDFIFGAGNAILEKCHIICRANETDFNYICAPSTRSVNPYGLFFYKCTVSVVKGDADIYLGRPWYDVGAKNELTPRALFYMCSLPSDLKLEFIKMKPTDPSNYEMYYYKCTQNKEEVSNIEDERIISFYEKIYEQRR